MRVIQPLECTDPEKDTVPASAEEGDSASASEIAHARNRPRLGRHQLFCISKLPQLDAAAEPGMPPGPWPDPPA